MKLPPNHELHDVLAWTIANPPVPSQPTGQPQADQTYTEQAPYEAKPSDLPPATKPLPEIWDWDRLMEEAEKPLPPEILKDLLWKGCRMSVEGSSKAGKTWTLMNLGLAAVQGTSWMGIKVVKPCRVLYMDFELIGRFAAHRMKMIKNALNSGRQPNFQYWPLRGSCYEFARLKEHLLVSGRQKAYDLVIVDPYYKAASGLDENSVADVMLILKEIEKFSEETETAIVYAHHYSKGNKSDVDAIDRGAGSGAFGRDPDAKVMLTRHMEKDCLTVEPMTRYATCPDSLVVETTFPTFKQRNDLDPDDLYNPARLEAYERKRDARKSGDSEEQPF
jgi:hypothetical protein